jgi:hypothetical protein
MVGVGGGVEETMEGDMVNEMIRNGRFGEKSCRLEHGEGFYYRDIGADFVKGSLGPPNPVHCQEKSVRYCFKREFHGEDK